MSKSCKCEKATPAPTTPAVKEKKEKKEKALKPTPPGSSSVHPLKQAPIENYYVGVVDGETIDVIRGGKLERIRLYGIDCPESHRDFWDKSHRIYGFHVIQ